MTCKTVRSSLSEYLDGQLSGETREALSGHVSECAGCGRKLAEMNRVRQAVRAMPQRKIPDRLRTRLRVLASHEVARRAAQIGPRGLFVAWLDRMQLFVDNLMRPLAIPFAGGVVSAFVLFSMIAPTFTVPAPSPDDVPTALYTLATVDALGPFGMVDEFIVLDVTVNDQGRMVEYSSPNQSPILKDPQLRRTIENNLLFTKFTPANVFGRPVASKVRIAIRRSHVDVKG